MQRWRRVGGCWCAMRALHTRQWVPQMRVPTKVLAMHALVMPPPADGRHTHTGRHASCDWAVVIGHESVSADALFACWLCCVVLCCAVSCRTSRMQQQKRTWTSSCQHTSTASTRCACSTHTHQHTTRRQQSSGMLPQPHPGSRIHTRSLQQQHQQQCCLPPLASLGSSSPPGPRGGTCG